MASVDLFAVDGGLGQEALSLRMGLQQPFHLESQRGVSAAGLVKVSRPLFRCLLLECCEKDFFHPRGTAHGTAPASRLRSSMRRNPSEPLKHAIGCTLKGFVAPLSDLFDRARRPRQ